MLLLTLRSASAIPLELDGIVPERVAQLSALAVARLSVPHGNRSAPLGEFFDVHRQAAGTGTPEIRFAGDTRNVKGIGAGMTGGLISVAGDAGMHAGAAMTGGELVIEGRAGDWLGAEMCGGRIVVRGDAGNQVGAAYRGSRRGMTGGTILVHGTAGDEVGLLMRRGLIVVRGVCGDFAGASMIAGTIVMCDSVGGRLGAGMKRGTLIAVVPPELSRSFRYASTYQPSFLGLYRSYLKRMGVDLPVLASHMRCYRGDILHGGRGEVLTATV